MAAAATTQINHSFTSICGEEKSAVDRDLFHDAVAIVAVGTTGTGKSSLINLFCSDAKVGKSTTSETTSSNIFKENDSRSWLDSQGANDSNGVDDQKVLTDVLRELYEQKINQIKVVWCVSGDMDRKKAEFQTQAKFIKRGLGDNDDAIWKCCLIVRKRGKLLPRKKMDGVLDAAKDEGSDIRYGDEMRRLIGFTYFDPQSIDEDNVPEELEMLFELTEPNSEKRATMLKKSGYLTREAIAAEIDDRLAALPTLQIEFDIRQCTKCGNKGDPRFVYAPCHTEKEKYHPKETVPRHIEDGGAAGSKIRVHPGMTQKYHPKSLQTEHSGQFNRKFHPITTLEKYHDGYVTSRHASYATKQLVHTSKSTYHCHTEQLEIKHPKPLTKRHRIGKETEKYHPQAVTTRQFHTGDFIVYMCNAFHDDYYKCCKGKKDSPGCNVEMYYPCCGQKTGTASKGCETRFRGCHCDEHHAGCIELYECCEQKRGAEGCSRKYPCCGNGVENTGCAERHQCCGKLKGSTGCTEQWSCCDNPATNKGCLQEYSCCDKEQSAEGCKDRYVCCKKDSKGPDSAGCSTKWSCCDATTKTGSVGCSQVYPCCNGGPNSDGCTNKYGCCGGDLQSVGCKTEWSCCGAPERNQGCKRVYECCEKELGAEGCADRCQSCHRMWGGQIDDKSGCLTPNGCAYPTAKK